MSAWKSPLLYLGMLIILVAGAALATPLFVDWDAYRDDFESYGRAAVGRDVEIAGGIEARLFPWPVLRLEDVKVANPPGASTPNLLAAGSIELKMQLAPLISGHVEVDSIEIDRATFGFERMPSGEWSWNTWPEPSLGRFVNPERVALAAVTLTNSTVVLADARRGGSARLEGVEMGVSAPALSGPWKMRGSASYRGAPIDIALNIGKLSRGEPVRVGLNIDPRDGEGLSYGFDGEIGRAEGKSIKGQLKVAPAMRKRETSDEAAAQNREWPRFQVRTTVEADLDTVEFSRIEIAPGAATTNGGFITGEARVLLGREIELDARLETARLDLDWLMRGREDILRNAASLEAMAAFLGQLPEGLNLGVGFDVTSLVIGGETLDASRFAVEASRGRLKIKDASLALPGQSRVGVSGLFVARDGGPQFSGDVSLDSISGRDFAEWAFADYRRGLQEVWSGARGRLKLKAKADATATSLRLSGIEATLDDAALSGGFSYRAGSQSELAIRLVADSVNVDRYAPDGLMPEGDARSRLSRGIDIAAAAMGLGNFQLTLQADRVRLHGVEAEDLAVDIGANEDGFELRTVQIGNVGQSRLDISGLMRFPGEAVAGSIDARVDAKDPRGLFRLFGLLEGEAGEEPEWIAALGGLDLKLVAEASSLNDYTQATASLAGTAGDMRISADGRFDGEIGNWRTGHLNMSGEARSSSSVLVAALLGIEVGGEDAPSRLKLTGTGSFERGVATSVEAEILGAKLQLAGALKHDGKTSFDGRGAVLAERVGGILAALDLPAAGLSPLASVLSAESAITYDGSVVSFTGLSGTAGGSSYQGDLKLALEPEPSLSGALSAGRISLPWLLTAALLRPDEETDLEDSFRNRLPLHGTLNLSLHANRLDIVRGFDVTSAAVKLVLGRETLRVEAEGSGPSKLPARLELSARLEELGATMTGSFEGRLDLRDVFLTEEGTPLIEGVSAAKLTFSGAGRTPAGLLAAAGANGGYELESGILKRVDPTSFGRDLASARTPADVDRLISASLRSGDVSFVGGKGSLALANGVLKASPLTIAGKGMTGELRVVVEAMNAEADIAVTISLIEPAGLPSFEIAYAGPPSAMQPSSNTQELKSQLAVRVLKEGIDQLEELQRQERQLLEEEEQFRREQQLRHESDREKQRKLNELEARRKIESTPPLIEEAPHPAAEPRPPAPHDQGQTDPAPAPVIRSGSAEAAPVPRKKPSASRAGLDARGPVVLPQSLSRTHARSPSLLFPNEPPIPLPDFPARAQGRGR